MTYSQGKRLVLQEPGLLFVRGFVGVAEVHEEEAFVVGRSGTIGQSQFYFFSWAQFYRRMTQPRSTPSRVSIETKTPFLDKLDTSTPKTQGKNH